MPITTRRTFIGLLWGAIVGQAVPWTFPLVARQTRKPRTVEDVIFLSKGQQYTRRGTGSSVSWSGQAGVLSIELVLLIAGLALVLLNLRSANAAVREAGTLVVRADSGYTRDTGEDGVIPHGDPDVQRLAAPKTFHPFRPQWLSIERTCLVFESPALAFQFLERSNADASTQDKHEERDRLTAKFPLLAPLLVGFMGAWMAYAGASYLRFGPSSKQRHGWMLFIIGTCAWAYGCWTFLDWFVPQNRTALLWRRDGPSAERVYRNQSSPSSILLPSKVVLVGGGTVTVRSSNKIVYMGHVDARQTVFIKAHAYIVHRDGSGELVGIV